MARKLKSLQSGEGYFSSCWSMTSIDPTNITCSCYFSWLLSRTWEWNPIARDTIYLSYRTQHTKAGTDLEVLSLLVSFHNVRTLYVHYWEEESIERSYPYVNPVVHNNEWTRKMYPYTHATCNSGMNVMKVTNHFLIGFKACFTRWNSFLGLLTRLKTV